MIKTQTILAVLLLLSGAAWCQDVLSLEQVVDSVYKRDSITRAEVGDMVMDAESYSRKLSSDGAVKEEKKFFKTYYFKGPLVKTVFHEFYLDGVRQDDKALQEQIKDDAERRRKGRARDASVDPLLPFHPENRSQYAFTLVSVEQKHGCICYHVTADCLIDDESKFEGDYWIETKWLNLVHAEFHPADLPTGLKSLELQKSYAPVEHGYWLPIGLQVRGKGQVLLFIKFNFAVEELYSKHKINTGLTDDFFKEAEK
jgi:hypothetical protein